MAARGMAADDERPPELRELPRGRPHLADDLDDRNRGTQIVARHGGVDAMGVQPGGEMTEERTIQRLPVAAVDEDDDRAGTVAGEQIDPVVFARPVRDHLETRLMRLAIGRCVA